MTLLLPRRLQQRIQTEVDTVDLWLRVVLDARLFAPGVAKRPVGGQINRRRKL